MPRHKTQLILFRTPERSNFRPLYKNKPLPIHHSQMKSFSATHTTIKSISFYTWIKSSSIPHTEIKPIWTTRTKFKSICMIILKTSDFRTAVKNQVNFDHPHNQQIDFIPTLKSSQVWSPTLKSSRFGPPTQEPNQVYLYTDIKSSSIHHTDIKLISTTITKTKSISTLKLKTNHFRAAHKYEVNFDPRTKNR